VLRSRRARRFAQKRRRLSVPPAVELHKVGVTDEKIAGEDSGA
jgi:hypothetical protein